MATPPTSSRTKWIWVALFVAVGVLLVIMLFNPMGDLDGDVDDPIASEPFGQEGVAQPADTTNVPAPEPFAPGGDPE